MRRLLTTLIPLLHAIPSLADQSIICKVIKVADGDTITILDDRRQQHRVRLAGIDAPESGQPFGKAFKKRLGELVAGKEVRIEFEKYDRYGRIVGKVLGTPLDCPTCGLLRNDLQLPYILCSTSPRATGFDSC